MKIKWFLFMGLGLLSLNLFAGQSSRVLGTVKAIERSFTPQATDCLRTLKISEDESLAGCWVDESQESPYDWVMKSDALETNNAGGVNGVKATLKAHAHGYSLVLQKTANEELKWDQVINSYFQEQKRPLRTVVYTVVP